MKNDFVNSDVRDKSSDLAAKVRRQMIIIGVLLVIIVVGVLIFFFSKNQLVHTPESKLKRFDVSVHDDHAITGTDDFRNAVRYTTIGDYKGIWYDTAKIGTYMRGKLNAIIERHTEHQRSNGIDITGKFKWVLAFYWSVKKKDAGDDEIPPAVNFYVLPVLVSLDGKQVLDYFVGNNSYYAHPKPLTEKPRDDEFNVYDEGHLWP